MSSFFARMQDAPSDSIACILVPLKDILKVIALNKIKIVNFCLYFNPSNMTSLLETGVVSSL
jgi:hypothetical protein